MRVGIGYDVHRLETGQPCRIGGVTIDHEKGCVGYSDGDPLLHAICDALLGAAGLGDIGCYFPEGDPMWQGISSRVLLKKVAAMLSERQYHPVQLDTIVIAEAPKIAPHVDEMKAIISGCLAIAPEAINIKATTNERIGFIGRGEGIAAQAVCTIAHD